MKIELVTYQQESYSMILEELRTEVTAEIEHYCKKYESFTQIPRDRQSDIRIVRKILKLDDPVLITKNLKTFLDSRCVPFLSFVTLFDVNYFAALIKKVLAQEKFQKINILQSIIQEQKQLITRLQIKPKIADLKTEDKLGGIMIELNLLRAENGFLYNTLMNLDKKISVIEAENKVYAQRANQAEKKLEKLKEKLKNIPESQSMIDNIGSLSLNI